MKHITEAIKLTTENLNTLRADVRIPTYMRGEVKTGIIHIGVGGFHRAHQAYLTDRLLETGRATDWGICGISLLASDKGIQEALMSQDGLYSLMVPDSNGNFSAQVIGSIVALCYAPENPAAAINRIAHESTRLITLTITEGGYNYTSNGAFNWNNDAVLWDLQHPDQPKTVFGYLYSALKQRRKQGGRGLTILSCDNIEHNGDITRRMLQAFMTKADPELINWLDEYVTFPNSMVDRITPVTTEKLKLSLAENFGVDDSCPVVCESYYQWIIEDSFAAGRPEWENVGAQLVSDVTPYEKMKIRLLNGGHTLVGLLGYLSGYRYIHESIADPTIARLLKKYMDEEVTPTLDPVPGIDLYDYKLTLIERFSNPFIKDEVTRIISGGSAKFQKFILPVILDQIEGHSSLTIAALITAAWYAYLVSNLSTGHLVQDDLAPVLLKRVKQAEQQGNPLFFLEDVEVFATISTHNGFTDRFLSYVTLLRSDDIGNATQAVLQSLKEKE